MPRHDRKHHEMPYDSAYKPAYGSRSRSCPRVLTHVLMASLIFSAFVLLVLLTFSTPFIRSFYFLQTSAAGGVRFGWVGYCRNLTGLCQRQYGYDFLLEFESHHLTRVLVLYPVAAGITLIAGLVLLNAWNTARHRRYRVDPHYHTFNCVAILAFLTSGAAFAATSVLFVRARAQFRAQGYTADLGTAYWMSLGAVVAVLLPVPVTILEYCFSRVSHHLSLTY